MIKPLLGRDLAEVLHERVGVAAPAKNAAEPVVSILIPVRNRLDLTRQCLASIDGHAAKGLATEILVIDDASDDGTPQWLAEHRPDVRVIRNGTAQGFARNMNRAAAAAAGEFLCLLNNDTLVTEDWLSAMLAVARHSPDVGVVGNKHLWPDSGLVNHAGMVFDEDRLPTHLYPGARADAPQVNVSRDFQILTAACWLVPADLFRTVGGFDERFVNGR